MDQRPTVPPLTQAASTLLPLACPNRWPHAFWMGPWMRAGVLGQLPEQVRVTRSEKVHPEPQLGQGRNTSTMGAAGMHGAAPPPAGPTLP